MSGTLALPSPIQNNQFTIFISSAAAPHPRAKVGTGQKPDTLLLDYVDVVTPKPTPNLAGMRGQRCSTKAAQDGWEISPRMAYSSEREQKSLPELPCGCTYPCSSTKQCGNAGYRGLDNAVIIILCPCPPPIIDSQNTSTPPSAACQ